MASPYILSNGDLQYVNCAGQSFQAYLAVLNQVNITTTWNDLNMDNQGNWQPPPNYDTAARHTQPYAPVANLGSNRIGFVNEPLYFDGSRSTQRYDLPANTGSHAWTITGPNTVVYYHNYSQCQVIWSQPGLYTIALTVTDRFGNSTTGTRQVMVYQNRQSALPGIISIAGLSGSISSGGWQMQCTTVNSQTTMLPPDALPPGSYLPIVLLVETSYEIAPGLWINRTIGPNGLFTPGSPYSDPRILFDGYVQSGTVHQDIDKDTLSFSCSGPQMILQEAKTHQLGYYNCAVAHSVNGVPTALKTAAAGQGFQVGGLMTVDVVHSILLTHSNVGLFHDLHIWNSLILTKTFDPSLYGKANNWTAFYYMIYTTLSVNEGTIWQNIQDLVANEFAQVYCTPNGSLCIGPLVNYMGCDFWSCPTLLGDQSAPFLINLVQELGYNVGSDLNSMTQNIPDLPSLPMPVTFVHPWMHQTIPASNLQSFGDAVPAVVATQSTLTGPPILCTFSDTPIYDTDMNPPSVTALYPWVANNWPQDLAIYPVSIDITENYTGRASLVKLIGTLYGHTTLWSSWWPRSAFKPVGDGTVSVVATTLPASDWVLDQTHVLPDVTSKQQAQLTWNWWWEMAVRMFYDHNANYAGSVTCGMFTGASLGDIVGITRQNTTLGPKFNNKPFTVSELSYSLDLTARTWTTTFTLNEVTSVNLGPIQAPPYGVPKG